MPESNSKISILGEKINKTSDEEMEGNPKAVKGLKT
jgi:hypothetical protein